MLGHRKTKDFGDLQTAIRVVEHFLANRPEPTNGVVIPFQLRTATKRAEE